MIAVYYLATHFFGLLFEGVTILKFIGVPLLYEGSVGLLQRCQFNLIVNLE